MGRVFAPAHLNHKEDFCFGGMATVYRDCTTNRCSCPLKGRLEQRVQPGNSMLRWLDAAGQLNSMLCKADFSIILGMAGAFTVEIAKSTGSAAPWMKKGGAVFYQRLSNSETASAIAGRQP